MATVTVTKKQVKIEDEKWSKKFENGPFSIAAVDINDQEVVDLISWTKDEKRLPELKKDASYQIEVIKSEDRGFGIQYTISLEKTPIKMDNELLNIIQEEKEVVIKEDIRQDTPEITTDINNGTQVVKYEEKNAISSIEFTGETNINIAVANFKLYEYVMNQIVGADDFAIIQGKKFLKKTGFKKLALAFNISDPEISFEFLDDNTVQVVATAIAPNGRISTDVAICEMSEVLGNKTKHNLLTKGVTRAKSRVISNLVGCGLVSFEEVQ